jgi:hypothetical protein
VPPVRQRMRLSDAMIDGRRRIDVELRAERRVRDRHHQTRGHSVSRRVAEQHRHAAVGQRHEVVDVAADRVGDAVERRDVPLLARRHLRGMRLACRSRASCSSSRNFTLSISSIARSTVMTRNVAAISTNVQNGGVFMRGRSTRGRGRTSRTRRTKRMRRCGASSLRQTVEDRADVRIQRRMRFGSPAIAVADAPRSASSSFPATRASRGSSRRSS